MAFESGDMNRQTSDNNYGTDLIFQYHLLFTLMLLTKCDSEKERSAPDNSSVKNSHYDSMERKVCNSYRHYSVFWNTNTTWNTTYLQSSTI